MITKEKCMASFGYMEGASDLGGCVPLALVTAPGGTVRFR